MFCSTYKRPKCEHNKQKSRCKDCGGRQICEHGKRRSVCIDCDGSEICEHGKQKHYCKDCGGSGICEHGKRRSICKDCGGVSICKHGERRTRCIDCGGSEICEHGRRKQQCKDCGGSAICEHNKYKSNCKDCGGSAICKHNKDKSRCKDCNGNDLCKSGKEPYNTGCRTRGNRKLNGFCSHCFANMFPSDPKTLSIRTKSKELKVVSHISQKFDGFINDKPLYVDLQGGCCATKRRIDLRKLIGNTMLCIEVDEDQHKSYIKKDDEIRYNDLYMDWSGKFLFIRYNPDKFKDKYNKTKNPFFDTRMDVLEACINKHVERINKDENNDLIEIHHIFYDEV
jgi:hypothetical protein